MILRVLSALLLLAMAVPAAADDVELGTAPRLAARDLDGKRFELADALEEGPVVVTFWATWCKPCRKEMPELQKLREKYADKGFQVVAVNGDGPVDQAKVRPFVKAQKFDFVVIPDQDGTIRRRFQVEVFPTTFLVAQDGSIVHRAVGYRRGDEKLTEARLAALLGLEATPLEGEDAPDADPGD